MLSSARTLEIAEYLLKRGANPAEALLKAVSSNNAEMAALLINNGALKLGVSVIRPLF